MAASAALLLAGGFIIWKVTNPDTVIMKSNVASQYQEKEILLDVLRAQGDINGIKYGHDELIYTKFIPEELNFQQVRQKCLARLDTNPGLVDQYFDVTKQRPAAPPDTIPIPLFTALSNWYPEATREWKRPYTDYTTATKSYM